MQLRYLPVVLTVALTGCGDGGGDTTVETPEATSPSLIDPPNDPVTSFIAPADAASLTAALTTRFESASDFDVWVCASESNPDNMFAYALPGAGTLGQGMAGIEYSLSTGGEVMITWQANSADTVTTEIEGSGIEITSTNYVFSNATTMSYLLSGFTINCSRIDNTVAFGGAVTQQPSVTVPTNPASDDSSPAQTPDGFSRLHAYNTFGFVGTSAQLVTEVIALFDDGSYTEDLSTVFASGVTQSLAQNPSDWGQYRFINGELNLRLDGDLDFEREPNDFSLEPAGSDTRLTGCYLSLIHI